MTRKKKIGIIIVCIIGIIIAYFAISAAYRAYNQKVYSGHGFDYMSGYSSTDFKGYHVYDGEKLVSLNHEASLWIEEEKDMPVMDGAEACYPVYTAVAKAIYKDIDVIEKKANKRYEEWEDKHFDEYGEPEDWYEQDEEDAEEEWIDKYNNGMIVTFTNTVCGYDRLIDDEVDLFFGARPSADQKEFAAEENKQIISTPIGSEAFVFFVEEDNPVDDLTSEQVRKIYHGDITNWKEIGGKDQKIVAFQRPEESGSQVMMEYFMGDVKLKAPDTYEIVDAMDGVIDEVKQYNNEAGAMGYTFRYFLEGLQQEKGVKMLAIDGVAPTQEHIADRTYPIIVPLVCAKIKGNDNPNVDKVIDFLRSKDGQYIITKTGYGPLDKNNADPIVENKIRK